MSATYEVSKTKFGQAMEKRMNTLKFSIKDVADQTGSTYEYIRKLVRGLSLPSKYMVRSLAPVLQWDAGEMEDMMVMDRVILKHGSAGLKAYGVDPDFEPFIRYLKNCTEKQKQLVMIQMREFVAQNKQNGIPLN